MSLGNTITYVNINLRIYNSCCKIYSTFNRIDCEQQLLDHVTCVQAMPSCGQCTWPPVLR